MLNPLFVPELFHYILDYLVTSSNGPANPDERRTLAALARTCSAFSTPSLDRLWCHLDSLLPLIRSFANTVDEATLQSPPSSQDWLIINRYAPRIRTLTLGNERRSLHFLQLTHLVLPNLRALKWKQPSDVEWETLSSPTTSFWSSLLTPKIDLLDVALPSPNDPGFQLFLERYPDLCPDLKSIKFDFVSEQGEASVMQALYRTICSRTDWRRVRLSCPLDIVSLRHLGLASTALKSVSFILFPDPQRPDKTYFEHAETPFRNVSRVYLTVWNRLDVAKHLLRSSGQNFHTFQVTLRNIQLTSVDLSLFLTSIASPRRMRSLRSLMVRRSRRYVPVPLDEVQQLTYETIRPIVSLVNLCELVITLDLQITIDDAEFAGLVCNWPNLRVFRLTGKCDESSKAISLRGLLSLLTSCRDLRVIGLSLDARQIPQEDASSLGADADTVCLPSVTRLTLQDCPIMSPALVVTFLLKHLPSIRKVHAPALTHPQWRRRRMWGQVNHIMRLRHEAAEPETTTIPSA